MSAAAFYDEIEDTKVQWKRQRKKHDVKNRDEKACTFIRKSLWWVAFFRSDFFFAFVPRMRESMWCDCVHERVDIWAAIEVKHVAKRMQCLMLWMKHQSIVMAKPLSDVRKWKRMRASSACAQSGCSCFMRARHIKTNTYIYRHNTQKINMSSSQYLDFVNEK